VAEESLRVSFRERVSLGARSGSVTSGCLGGPRDPAGLVGGVLPVASGATPPSSAFLSFLFERGFPLERDLGASQVVAWMVTVSGVSGWLGVRGPSYTTRDTNATGAGPRAALFQLELP